MDLRIIEIAEHYGLITESEKCDEELTELRRAIDKNDEPNIEEEMADVLITICEQIHLRGCGDKVKDMVDAKLNRQITRMENEQNCIDRKEDEVDAKEIHMDGGEC